MELKKGAYVLWEGKVVGRLNKALVVDGDCLQISVMPTHLKPFDVTKQGEFPTVSRVSLHNNLTADGLQVLSLLEASAEDISALVEMGWLEDARLYAGPNAVRKAAYDVACVYPHRPDYMDQLVKVLGKYIS